MVEGRRLQHGKKEKERLPVSHHWEERCVAIFLGTQKGCWPSQKVGKEGFG